MLKTLAIYPMGVYNTKYTPIGYVERKKGGVYQ